MDRWLQTRKCSRRRGLDRLGGHALGGLLALPILISAVVVSPHLVLPVASLLALAGAAALTLFAWHTRARRDGSAVTAWDLAGAFVLIGCVAATLGEASSVADLSHAVN